MAQLPGLPKHPQHHITPLLTYPPLLRTVRSPLDLLKLLSKAIKPRHGKARAREQGYTSISRINLGVSRRRRLRHMETNCPWLSLLHLSSEEAVLVAWVGARAVEVHSFPVSSK